MEKGLPITRNKEGLLGWRGTEAGKEGLLSPGPQGASCGLWTPCCPARLGAGSGQGLSHLEMGEKWVSVQK